MASILSRWLHDSSDNRLDTRRPSSRPARKERDTPKVAIGEHGQPQFSAEAESNLERAHSGHLTPSRGQTDQMLRILN
jgi:hypothetical protein